MGITARRENKKMCLLLWNLYSDRANEQLENEYTSMYTCIFIYDIKNKYNKAIKNIKESWVKEWGYYFRFIGWGEQNPEWWEKSRQERLRNQVYSWLEKQLDLLWGKIMKDFVDNWHFLLFIVNNGKPLGGLGAGRRKTYLIFICKDYTRCNMQNPS